MSLSLPITPDSAGVARPPRQAPLSTLSKRQTAAPTVAWALRTSHAARIRALAPLFLAALLIAGALLIFDAERIPGFVENIGLRNFGVALGLLLANQVLAGLRFHLLLGGYGIRQGFARSLRINTFSVFGGLFLTSFFGQSLSRAALIGRIEHSQAIAFVLTGLERIVALTLLACLAIAGAFHLFGGIDLRMDKAGMLVFLVVTLAAVAMTVSWSGLRRRHRQLLGRVLLADIARPALRAGAVTMAMHGTMLAAYVTLAQAVAPAAPLDSLLAIGAVVMFSAAIPISPAGWGVREITAAHAFSVIAIAPEAGLTMAIAVGVLSLIALGIVAAVVVPFAAGWREPRTGKMIDDRIAGRLVRLVSLGTPVVCGTLVLFQLPLPTASGAINVNLGDPFAILGALTLVSMSVVGGRWRRLWRVPYMNAAIVAAALVMVFGFLHGVAVIGVTDWALFNRLIGFAVLICFLLTGALVTTVGGQAGFALLSRVFIAAVAAVVASELGLRLFDGWTTASLFEWEPRFAGMAGNPNAFATQLALALAVALPARHVWIGRRAGMVELLILGLIAVGVWYSASRAAWGAILCLVALYLLLGRLDVSRLGRSILGALLIIGAVALIGLIDVGLIDIGLVDRGGTFGGLGLVDRGGTFGPNLLGFTLTLEDNTLLQMQQDRWLSLVGGFYLWLEHPVFGAGLGTFIQQQIEATGTPLVIHNSALWLAAELGLVGLLVFLFVPVALIGKLWVDRVWRDEWSGAAILGSLCVIGVMSLVHELAYQRTFWLLAGAALALPGSLSWRRQHQVSALSIVR